MPNINTNQFEQLPIRGMVDDNIAKSATIISVVVSASQASALNAGDYVQFDTSAGKVPSIIKATIDAIADGVLIYDVKKASPVAGDYVQIALMNGASITWEVAGGTIAAGDAVEDATAGGTTLATLSSHKMRGIALDPAISGDLFRVINRNALQS